MHLNKVVSALLVLVVLTLSGCGGGGSSSNSDSPSQAPSAAGPSVTNSTQITTLNGEVIQVDKTATGLIFHGLEGKIILLEVYGDTCPHCVSAIPSYNRLQQKYRNDVVVIALETYGTLTNAHKQQYITVPKAHTGNMFAFINSLTGYNLNAVPYLMILDRNGDVVYDSILSDFPQATIEGLIQSLL